MSVFTSSIVVILIMYVSVKGLRHPKIHLKSLMLNKRHYCHKLFWELPVYHC